MTWATGARLRPPRAARPGETAAPMAFGCAFIATDYADDPCAAAVAGRFVTPAAPPCGVHIPAPRVFARANIRPAGSAAILSSSS